MRWHKSKRGLIVPEKPTSIIRARGDALTRDGLLRTRGGNLAITNLIGFAVGGADTFYDKLVSVFGAGAINCSMDAGDIASTDGSSQTWTDRSGTQDFWRGADGSASTDDPTYNGAAGAGYGSSQYWSVDGGDFFRAKAQPTWADNMHKDNAKFTVGGYFYTPASANDSAIIGTNDNTNSAGVIVFVDPGLRTNIFVSHGTGTALQKFSDTGPTNDAWNFYAVSIDEAAGAAGGFFYLNGAYSPSTTDTWNPAYTTPSTGAATYTVEVMGRGNAGPYTQSGGRVGVFFVLNVAASKTNLDTLWDQTHGAFGI